MKPLLLYWWRPERQPLDLYLLARAHMNSWRSMRRFGSPSVRNFGDELSRLVVEHATGRSARWTSRNRADVVGIGSVLEMFASPTHEVAVWGTGLRFPLTPPSMDLGRLHFLAVRGPLTRAGLQLTATTPTGDPGLLLRSMVRPHPRRGGTLMLPHFADFGLPGAERLLKLCQGQGMRVIAPTAPARQVVDAINSAEYVMTSSLHGLVVSHALGVPVTLVRFEGSTEPAHKFRDYFESLDLGPGTSAAPLAAALAATPQLRAAAEREKDLASRTIDEIVEALLSAARALA